MIDVCGKSKLKCEKRWCDDIVTDDGEVTNSRITVGKLIGNTKQTGLTLTRKIKNANEYESIFYVYIYIPH